MKDLRRNPDGGLDLRVDEAVRQGWEIRLVG
jgi:hypothetical protein